MKKRYSEIKSAKMKVGAISLVVLVSVIGVFGKFGFNLISTHFEI